MHDAVRLLFAVTAMLTIQGADPAKAQQPLPSGQFETVPLPERNPARIDPPSPPHPGDIDTPDWTPHEIQAALDRCAMMLADAGVVYRTLDPVREGRCGTPAPIELSAIGKTRQVTIEPAATVTCELAASLSAWSDLYLQRIAREHLQSQITTIRNVASYVCRNRYGDTDKPISEHALANALDMAAFKTEQGDWVSVLEDWYFPPDEVAEAAATGQQLATMPAETAPGPTPAEEQNSQQAGVQAEAPQRLPEPTSRARFLAEIHAAGCALFATVLGPLSNEAHKDHFHFDLAPRRHSNFCQ